MLEWDGKVRVIAEIMDFNDYDSETTETSDSQEPGKTQTQAFHCPRCKKTKINMKFN